MDAKSRANFINSVAAGQTVPCPRCGAANRPDAVTCNVCGSPLAVKSTENNTPAFATVSANTSAGSKSVRYEESAAVFADGLPSWDILPPQVVVRRR